MKKIGAFVVSLILLVSVLCVGAVSARANGDSYIPGDANNDDKVNVRDLGLLQQYLNGWEVTLNAAAADVTGDGKVNVRDLGLLQQYLNGWDVSLEPAVDMPGAGYDMDGRSRIFVQSSTLTREGSALKATFTFVNRSKDYGREWIIPETTRVTYACYDANGTQLGTGTMTIGALEYRDTVTRTITLPAGTAKIVFTGHNLEYWTPWA